MGPEDCRSDQYWDPFFDTCISCVHVCREHDDQDRCNSKCPDYKKNNVIPTVTRSTTPAPLDVATRHTQGELPHPVTYSGDKLIPLISASFIIVAALAFITCFKKSTRFRKLVRKGVDTLKRVSPGYESPMSTSTVRHTRNGSSTTIEIWEKHRTSQVDVFRDHEGPGRDTVTVVSRSNHEIEVHRSQGSVFGVCEQGGLGTPPSVRSRAGRRLSSLDEEEKEFLLGNGAETAKRVPAFMAKARTGSRRQNFGRQLSAPGRLTVNNVAPSPDIVGMFQRTHGDVHVDVMSVSVAPSPGRAASGSTVHDDVISISVQSGVVPELSPVGYKYAATNGAVQVSDDERPSFNTVLNHASSTNTGNVPQGRTRLASGPQSTTRFIRNLRNDSACKLATTVVNDS